MLINPNSAFFEGLKNPYEKNLCKDFNPLHYGSM